ncbi:N-terminal domain of NEFA-interacting nuclear protein NIP30-domain-containing protein [Xylaria sp. FL1777]|nr:N-terminal domain of NEFA-interacting nuclear protein NIP30-domain-containing protein [Xylaria sp. FL1777]
MTSRFVSGGVIAGDGDSANEDKGKGISDDGGQRGTGMGIGAEGGKGTAASVEWEAVQKDLDEERRRRAEARKRDVESGGEKSLYEILQANKAAKQAAFEEQNRIRNQFRALDDDEIEFLHGVNDERRAEEERVRRETEEGLASFRKAQQAVGGGDAANSAGVGNADGDDGVMVEEWGAAATVRKRKREREKAGFKGVKRRTSMPEEDKNDERKVPGEALGDVKGKDDLVSSTEQIGNDHVKLTHTKLTPTPTESESVAAKEPSTTPSTQTIDVTSTSKPKPTLGLVDYGSDEDDDD